MSDDSAIRLRGHHLLCLQGFQGYGYDKSFIRNLRNILHRFDTEPDLQIEVITECDDICIKCPHQKDGVCIKEQDSADKIRDMDERVLRKAGIDMGDKGTADELIGRVNERLKEINDIQPICGDCEWKKDCLWYLSRLHQI